MKNVLESQPVIILSCLNSVLVSTISYLQFLSPNSTLLAMFEPIIILKVIAIGLLAFGVTYTFVVIVRKLIKEAIQETEKKLDESIVVTAKAILSLDAKSFAIDNRIFRLVHDSLGNGGYINFPSYKDEKEALSEYLLKTCGDKLTAKEIQDLIIKILGNEPN